MSNSCCVVVPIHTLQMNQYQYASIIQTVKMLHSFDIYLVHPRKLDVSPLKNLISKDVAFDNIFFDTYGGYNKLCMTSQFYEAFLQYDYMLIAQNDTWIFKNELQMWCDKNYDYIGAPLCHYCNNVRNCHYIEDPVDVIVGNGGLSLRKIKKCIEASKYIHEHDLLKDYQISDIPVEDTFLMRLPIGWKTPKCSEAIHFSIEGLALKHAQSGIIPFGYHNLLKIFPQAMLLLHFNYNIQQNIQYFKCLM